MSKIYMRAGFCVRRHFTLFYLYTYIHQIKREIRSYDSQHIYFWLVIFNRLIDYMTYIFFIEKS